MELNHDEVKSCIITTKNGAFSFQWKIYNFYSLRPNISISSPEFYYKDNSYPWFLKLKTLHIFHPTCSAELKLHSNSNDYFDFKFTITVAHNGDRKYENISTWFSFSQLRPAYLLRALELQKLDSTDVLDITCTIDVTGLEGENHSKIVTILHPNLKSSESQSDQQSFSNQNHNDSGKSVRKEQEDNSLLNTVIIADSDDSPDFETMRQVLIDFKRMLTQTMNTDVAIQVEDTTIKAHKAVLSSRSPVFCKMFEHLALETTKGEIEVTDIQASIMKKLINYLYCGEKDSLQYEEACELYYAADKYEILGLREACMKDLLSLLDVSNACPMLSLAYRHSDEAFKEQIMNFISKNFKSIANTESWIELTDKDTKLAALLMRYCADALTK
ncbi:speckle-type POZ protein-like [Parasteatoda tepidariorum]|uniref:speckle-type POZ protein-like n=1 Tax=Parasteatoda tepidariorum TaxID=114398 RepID=UPI0039BC5A20